jgi:hypothetical protein
MLDQILERAQLGTLLMYLCSLQSPWEVSTMYERQVDDKARSDKQVHRHIDDQLLPLSSAGLHPSAHMSSPHGNQGRLQECSVDRTASPAESSTQEAVAQLSPQSDHWRSSPDLPHPASLRARELRISSHATKGSFLSRCVRSCTTVNSHSDRDIVLPNDIYK